MMKQKMKLTDEKIKVRQTELCTGHKVYIAETFETLEYGQGNTKEEAIKDLKTRVERR